MATTLAMQLAAQKRRTFVGKTDTYMQTPTYVPTLASEFGLLDIWGPHNYSDAYTSQALTRLTQYKSFYRFYAGNQWVNPWDNNERKPVFNFCKPIVDKSVEFCMGMDSWHLMSPAGDDVTAEKLSDVWRINNKDILTQGLLQSASIAGDAYLLVTYNLDAQRVELTPLQANLTFPLWHPTRHEMTQCTLQFPNENKALVITPTKIFTHEGDDVKEEENTYGFVNVVHLRNHAVEGTFFGLSDLDAVIPLNEEYNSICHTIRRILKYHGEPTTVIYGAKASSLEKSANSIWSGLPPPGEAKVENLMLTADLDEMYNYLKEIRQQIYVVSATPAAVFEIPSAHSNTSGVALEVMFKPLLDKTRTKQRNFSEMVANVNAMIAKILAIYAPNDLVGDTTTLKVKYSSPLPRDIGAELDKAGKRLSMKITSRDREMRRFAEADNIEQLATEIGMDDAAELLRDFERAKALERISPNTAVALLTSIAVTSLKSDDFRALIAEMAKRYADPDAAINGEEQEEQLETEE
jgi:hypothetical protein